MLIITVKKNNKLVKLGEGRIYSKSQLKLNELNGLDANIGTANGIQQAQMKAKQLMNQNAGVTSASADAGKIDGQNDRFSRPVIVLRKHSERCFTGIPLTSKRHKGSWYVSFVFQNRIQTAVLVQARLMDAARVYSRMGELSKKDYMLILKAYVSFIKGKNMR